MYVIEYTDRKSGEAITLSLDCGYSRDPALAFFDMVRDCLPTVTHCRIITKGVMRPPIAEFVRALAL